MYVEGKDEIIFFRWGQDEIVNIFVVLWRICRPNSGLNVLKFLCSVVLFENNFKPFFFLTFVIGRVLQLINSVLVV